MVFKTEMAQLFNGNRVLGMPYCSAGRLKAETKVSEIRVHMPL
jgi:hypothetical protein